MRSLLTFLFILFTPLLPLTAVSAENVRVLSATAQQVTLEFQPQWNEHSFEANGIRYQKLSFDGAEITGDIGEPQIPVRTAVVGVPPTGEAIATILETESETLENVRLAPLQHACPCHWAHRS